MKTLLIILFSVFLLSIKAQMPFPIDTTPTYRYLFITDSVGFINTEYIVRTDLIKQGGKMKIWCYPAVDTITHTVYACETPSPDRFIKMTELASIKEDILAFARGLYTLQQLKIITYGSTVSEEYKRLIYSIQFINTKKYRVNMNFKNFK